ncbi:MAG: hypothetical protein ABI128_10000 [Rhodanobacter sp.]
MNDIAYDISHLFDVEPWQAAAPEARAVRTVPTVLAKLPPPSVAVAQDALARELMQSAPIHEALIQQYLRMRGDTFGEACSE